MVVYAIYQDADTGFIAKRWRSAAGSQDPGEPIRNAEVFASAKTYGEIRAQIPGENVVRIGRAKHDHETLIEIWIRTRRRNE